MSIRPLGDRVLVKRMAEETTTASGIYLPDSAKEKPAEGEVVAVGPGKSEGGSRVELTVKAGDKVMFGKFSGQEIKVDGEDMLMMREDDIMAIVE